MNNTSQEALDPFIQIGCLTSSMPHQATMSGNVIIVQYSSDVVFIVICMVLSERESKSERLKSN